MTNSPHNSPNLLTRKPRAIRIRRIRKKEAPSVLRGDKSDIPNQNIVDLRTVMAERALEQARVRRAQAMKRPARSSNKNGSRKAIGSFFAARRRRKNGSVIAPPPPVVLPVQSAQPESLPPSPQYQKSEPEDIFATFDRNRKQHGHAEDDGWMSLDAPQSSSFPQTSGQIFEPEAAIPVAEEETVVNVSVHTIWKPLLIFCSFAIVFVLPASVSAMLRKTQTAGTLIQTSSEEAFDHLQNGARFMKNFQFREAQEEFHEATTLFDDASQHIRTVNPALAAIAPYIPGKGKEFASGRNLLFAGNELAISGEHIAEAFAMVTALQQESHGNILAAPKAADGPNDGHAALENGKNAENGELTRSLVLLHSALFPAVEHVNNAASYLRHVNPNNLPEEKRAAVRTAQEQLPAVQQTLIKSVNIVEIFLSLLGHDAPKRYLVLFQNNHELRPTGGFIGSLALVDIEKGVVTSLDVPAGGVYDIAGQFPKKIVPPQPLQLVNPSWNLQDANWFPHFPASAQKIQWFYEQAGGPSVDGVITVVPSVVEELLRLSGPIDMTQDFGTIIDADNFYDEFQTRAEEKFDVTRESKKIIGAMLPQLLQRVVAQLNDPERVIALVQMLQTSLDAKDIMMYMHDPILEHQISLQGWTGEITQTDRDYFSVVHANIAGGKTDTVIENVITHEAVIGEDGAITDTVTLTRVHKGSEDDPFTNVKNTDYVRFYVPEGSTLLAAEGFNPPDVSLFLRPEGDAERDADLQKFSGDILLNEATHAATNTEFGKLAIGGWMQTPVGASSTVKITYRLPFRLHVGGIWQQTDRYSLFVQKQPGSVNTTFKSDIHLPAALRQGLTVPAGFQGHTKIILDKDYSVGFVVEKR